MLERPTLSAYHIAIMSSQGQSTIKYLWAVLARAVVSAAAIRTTGVNDNDFGNYQLQRISFLEPTAIWHMSLQNFRLTHIDDMFGNTKNSNLKI